MCKMKFVFVILHYNAIEYTLQCVDSIVKTQNDNYRIVIVDNNSPDGSGLLLQEKFSHSTIVNVLISEENIGFARGNNIGFKFAKYNLKADFIILLNNDTLVLQNNFQELIINEYESSDFAVLGPYIKTPNPPYNSNPIVGKISSVKELRRNLFNTYILLFLSYFHADNSNIILKIRKKKDVFAIEENKNRMENVTLHGSFLIFSPSYISKFDGLNDRTFLYKEEELLFLRLKKNGLKSVYSPQIEVFHYEDASTNTIVSSNVKKRRFIYKNIIKSLYVLLDETKSMEKDYNNKII